MRVDKDLIAAVVKEILGQISVECKVENILVLTPRNNGSEIPLPARPGTRVEIYYSDDIYDAGLIHRYILPRLEINDMVDLASGKASTSAAEAVRNLLLAGKTVEVVEYSYTAHEGTAQPQLFQLYRSYHDTLCTFGLHPIKPIHNSIRLPNRVVSEHDMKSCSADGIRRICVARDTIVTSLAEECARRYGIEIQREERGA